MTEAAREPRLTDEQLRAIEQRIASVALGAGAGCGKTTVLTERFLAEIEDPGEHGGGRALAALAALTFTEKAARELRQRIRARCREKLQGGADPGRWHAVLRALEAAPIGTFHEFCTSLLRDHALALGIDPEFTVLNETVASSLRDQAIRSILRRLLADRDPDLLNLGVDYGLGQIREAIGWVIARRSREALEALAAETVDELVERRRRHWDEQGRVAVLGTLRPAAAGCREVLEGLGDGHPRLRERQAALLALLPSLEAGTCGEAELAEARGLARIEDLREKAIWPSTRVKDAVRDAFKALRERINHAVSKLAASEAVTRESAENSLRLARVASLARREYDRVKARRRGLDFDDLLHRTLELLGPDLTAGMTGIQFVLVDEFQDTDGTQSEILRRLGGDGFLGGRMFVVGDAKQSIYRFRGAEPVIFERWRTEFLEPGRLLLTENFRSVPGIIHFINALFADCFREAATGGTQDESPPRLAPRRGDGFTNPAVSWLWALPRRQEDDPDGSGPRGRKSAEDRRINEARVLATWLRERLDKGWTIVDRQTGRPRLAHAGDVALLCRAMTDVWPYEMALADAGFDYHTTGGSAFFAQQEVRDVVNVLSVVEDPRDEVALAGVLRSPFFSLSDEGLFWLARKHGGLAEGLGRASELDGLSDHDRAAVSRAAGLLARWRGLKDRVPLASLVSTILDESGFEAALVCEFLGSRKLANTRKLVRLAREFDRQENFSLADLVARLRADIDDPPREEQAATTDENSPTVRLMSIHQAKGLEFPIVLVPDLNRKPNPPEPLVGLHPDLGLLIRPARPVPVADADGEADPGGCLGWMTFQAVEAEEERREALRLFYVAVTRARDHLVLSAGLDEDRDDESSPDLGKPRAASPAFELLLERFDWQTGACLARLPAGWPAPRVEVLVQRAPDPEPGPPRPPAAPRLGLQEIERILTTATAEPAPQPTTPDSTPRWVDLTSVPSALDGHAARLDQLLHLAIADPGLLGGESPAAACARAGARLAPAASSRLIAEAARWLDRWSQTALHAELRDALRCRRPIERGVAWTLTTSPDCQSAATIRGRFDLLYLDRTGRWRAVILGTEPSAEAADLLRLALAGTAAERLGKVPCGPAWWVHPMADGMLDTEVQLSPSSPSVEAAFARWLEAARGASSSSPYGLGSV
jgi:ATP-dependent helicase/nuclease subunit A